MVRHTIRGENEQSAHPEENKQSQLNAVPMMGELVVLQEAIGAAFVAVETLAEGGAEIEEAVTRFEEMMEPNYDTTIREWTPGTRPVLSPETEARFQNALRLLGGLGAVVPVEREESESQVPQDNERSVQYHQRIITEDIPSVVGERYATWLEEHPLTISVSDSIEGSQYGEYTTGFNRIILYYDESMNSSAIHHMDAHETFHYISYANGGFDVRYQTEDGNVIHQGEMLWSQEGHTEYFSMQASRNAGDMPDTVAYPHETRFAGYLCHLVGQETVLQAYITGDFSEVRRSVNGRLGEGIFERLYQSENGAEALVALETALDSAGIDYNAWLREDPVLAGTEVGG
ncbi:hypothetical protein KKF81_06575 [Candidatus Micrarchaeota archaeon]|nr:hypothetical protein [Candidatus Micrarchaeota archaeon]MBU1166593.1 hypothetical protein [Candidatus Micrarchaeota archaeon]MBU1887275.1 hypothetical protein [Candidatus Micrarchaeota archaeon]